jgi:hypothetical protein
MAAWCWQPSRLTPSVTTPRDGASLSPPLDPGEGNLDQVVTWVFEG